MGIRAKRPGAKRPRANGNKGETTQGRTGFRAKRPGFFPTVPYLFWNQTCMSYGKMNITYPKINNTEKERKSLKEEKCRSRRR